MIRELHIELTERCNADCPMCGRTQSGGKPNANLENRELRLQDFKDLVPQHILSELESIRFCGNFGDPAAARDALEIVQYVRSTAPRAAIQLHSNGGLRGTDWWYELGRMLGNKHSAVFFGIDGLADSNHLYRRGVRWDVLMANVEAFIRAGSRAHWVFLAFEHNEHQVEKARTLAEQLGFAQFTVKASKRFLKARELELHWQHPVCDESQNRLYTIGPPKNWSLRNPALRELEHVSSRNLEKMLEGSSITCKAVTRGGLYISAEGLLFPCCWTAASIYPSYSEGPSGEIWSLLEQTGGKEQIDLRSASIESAVQSRFFRELAQRWTRTTFASGKPKLCARICGEGVQLFESQFQHHVLQSSDDGWLPERRF